MIYKTHKDVYLTVSERYGIDLEMVRLMGDFYYNDVSERVAKLDKREMYLNKLGSLKFRKAKSLRFIERIPKIELMMRALDRSEESIKNAMDNAYWMKGRMEILNDEWEFIRQEYHKHKEKKYAYRDLQKQKADMGGVEKPSI